MGMKVLYEDERGCVTVSLIKPDDDMPAWEVMCDGCGDSDSGLDLEDMIASRDQHLADCAGVGQDG